MQAVFENVGEDKIGGNKTVNLNLNHRWFSSLGWKGTEAVSKDSKVLLTIE